MAAIRTATGGGLFTIDGTGVGTASQAITSGDTLVLAGAGLITTVAGPVDTVTIEVTQEAVQDAVGAMLNGVGFVYDDAGNQWDSTGLTGLVLSSDGAGGATWTGVNALVGLQVLDTDCIGMILTGTGTTVDPWIISAEPIIGTGIGAQLVLCGPDGLVGRPEVYGLGVGDDPNVTIGDPGVQGAALAYEYATGVAWHWDEVNLVWVRSWSDYRDHLIEQGPISGAATDTFAAHIDAPLFDGPGIIDHLYISAFDLGLDGDVTIEVAVDNGATIVGTLTLVSSGGQMLDSLAVNVPIAGAGLHTLTCRISATMATVGFYEDFDLAVDFRYIP